MTAQDELTLLETAYANLLAGGVQEVHIGTRSYTRLDFKFLTARMDQLRAQVIRATSGMTFVSQFRPPE